jgi:CRP-like cAMP-binding protein
LTLRRRFSDATSIPAECGPDRPGGTPILHAIDPGPLSNRLLATLPRKDYQLILPHLTSVQLAQSEVLYEARAEVDQVYFPLSGMVSMLVVMSDGNAIETATVGREGVVGAMSGHGLHTSKVRSVVQLPMFASKIASSALRKVVKASSPIADLCIKYNEALLGQARVTAACNALHHIEPRFCRWLLQTRDRAESDSFPLTQEFLADMLGVRRTSVTEVAQNVQASGAISYSRGLINIVDLEKLKAMACECYEALRGD